MTCFFDYLFLLDLFDYRNAFRGLMCSSRKQTQITIFFSNLDDLLFVLRDATVHISRTFWSAQPQSKPLKCYIEFFIDNGMAWFQRVKIFRLKEEKRTTLKFCRDDWAAWNLCVNKTSAKIRQSYSWPGLEIDFRQYIRGCEVYTKRETPTMTLLESCLRLIYVMATAIY